MVKFRVQTLKEIMKRFNLVKGVSGEILKYLSDTEPFPEFSVKYLCWDPDQRIEHRSANSNQG